jgi:hypothetical protein
MNTLAYNGISPLYKPQTLQNPVINPVQSISQAKTPLPTSNLNQTSQGSGLTVKLSAQAHSYAEKAERVEQKYADTQNVILQQQTSARTQTASTQDANGAIGLHGLPPIKLFNAQDVKNYEKKLMSALEARGVDTSQKIDLATDFEGRVYVKNDHPDKDAIEKTINNDKDLRNGFVQTSNFYMFREIYAQHQQWAQKIESGVEEEIANLWLINSVKNTVAKSGEGLSFVEGKSQDPFGHSGNGNNFASKLAAAYKNT